MDCLHLTERDFYIVLNHVFTHALYKFYMFLLLIPNQERPKNPPLNQLNLLQHQLYLLLQRHYYLQKNHLLQLLQLKPRLQHQVVICALVEMIAEDTIGSLRVRERLWLKTHIVLSTPQVVYYIQGFQFRYDC